MEHRHAVAASCASSVEAGRLAFGIRSRLDIRDWLRGPVRREIPHESALVLHATSHSLGFTIEDRISIDLPAGYVAGILNAAGQIRGPLVSQWMRTRETQYFDGEHAWPGLDPDWLRHFQAHGLRSCAFFGRADAAECRATFLALYNLPRGTAAAVVKAGAPLLEPLHRAMTSGNAAAESESPLAAIEQMTPAEREVLRWVRLGRTNTEIAMILGRSRFTVKTHIQRMLAKTGLDNRTQLSELASSQRLSARGARTWPR